MTSADTWTPGSNVARGTSSGARTRSLDRRPAIPVAFGVIIAPLDGKWTSVMTLTRETGPLQLEEALANADRDGFTFGDRESFARSTRLVRSPALPK